MMQRVDVRIVLALVLVAVGFGLGSLRGGGDGEGAAKIDGAGHDHATEAAEAEAEPTIWTCSMHPQIQLPKPGKCPICGMDLIPQESGASDAEGPKLVMSEAAMKLAEVQTTEVVRRRPHVQVRMVGKVAVDETRQRQIAAWVGGRIDRMYVDYEGIAIRKGDHLAWIYSPELVSSQEELLQALEARESLGGSNSSVLRDTANKTVIAAREKLRLLGLSESQVEAIESSGEVEDHITINAPIDGVVMSKRAVEGDYVKTGAPIYEIADLGHLWVKMDAYESDLVWLRYGQKVSFATEAYPGQTVTGTITFIDPVLDPRTRTAKVRVNVDNERGLLKPGMFVRATVDAEIAHGGRVIDESLRGKWISPMHPEVIKDHPGQCDVCGMDLVRVEELGYVTDEKAGEVPLVIPTSAALLTGKRAVVYVRVPEQEKPTFEGREVVLGPRAGDVYLVESGLSEGELVVTQGAFKIDSSMQIQAKPSMMSPEGGAPATGHHHGSMKDMEGHASSSPPAEALAVSSGFELQFTAVLNGYLDLTDALAHDDLDKAQSLAGELKSALAAVNMGELSGTAHMQWMGLLRDLDPAIDALAKASDIEGLRAPLPKVDAALSSALTSFDFADLSDVGGVREFHCPMAFDGAGANWLQRGDKTMNPYFGEMMQGCGDQVRVLSSQQPVVEEED